MTILMDPDSSPVRIGLIADGHGDYDATERSLRVLRERGVDLLVHLGDFCDSVRNNGLTDMIRLLRKNAVFAIRGNNDHLVERMLRDSRPEGDPLRDAVIGFMGGVPMRMVIDDLCFAHSLPYDAIRSFYEPIDIGTPKRARWLFRDIPYRLLFCGHSHMPVFFRWKDGEVTREGLEPGEPLSLQPDERYIMIVGAAYEGECALLDRDAGTYERIRVF